MILAKVKEEVKKSVTSVKVLIPLTDGGYTTRGAVHYARNCLLGIKKVDDANNYVILKDKRQNFIDEVASENTKVIDASPPFGRFKIHWWYAFVLPKLVKSQNPDIVHFQNTYLISKKLNNSILTIHDLAEFDCFKKHGFLKSFIRRLILKKNVKRATLLIAVSDYTKKRICDIFGVSPQKVKVVKNAIDTQVFQEDKAYANPLDKSGRKLPEKYFLYVGAVEKSKNVDILIKAVLNHNLKNQKKANLVIVGNFGNQLREIKKFVNNNNLNDNIYFTSYLNDESLVAVFRNAYAFIHPSSFEGFGIVLLQAMASSVPVIAANATAFPEVVGDAGILYDPFSYEELSEKMKLLLEDKHLYEELQLKGLERVKMFSFEKNAEDLINIYKTLCPKN